MIVPSVTGTVTIPAKAAVGTCRFTVAVPGLLATDDVAVMVMGELGLGRVAGAVYRPLFGSIEPLPVPVTAQVTV